MAADNEMHTLLQEGTVLHAAFGFKQSTTTSDPS